MIGPMSHRKLANTLGQHCPQMTPRPGHLLRYNSSCQFCTIIPYKKMICNGASSSGVASRVGQFRFPIWEECPPRPFQPLLSLFHSSSSNLVCCCGGGFGIGHSIFYRRRHETGIRFCKKTVTVILSWITKG